MKKRAHVLSAALIFVFIMGCSGYARLRPQYGPNETMTIDKLKSNWQNYHILYAGLEPNVPSAVLFDRTDDDRNIIGERWWEMKDYETLSDTIEWIQQQINGPYYPIVYEIRGPDDYLYGYMFTAWHHAVMRQVDEKTLSVLDLPLPPGMMYGPGVIKEPR